MRSPLSLVTNGIPRMSHCRTGESDRFCRFSACGLVGREEELTFQSRLFLGCVAYALALAMLNSSVSVDDLVGF